MISRKASRVLAGEHKGPAGKAEVMTLTMYHARAWVRPCLLTYNGDGWRVTA